MGKYNGAVITTAGQNMIAQAIAQSQTITFMTMDASSHVYPASTNFESLTSLEDVESTININYAGVYNNNVVQVSGRFDNNGIETPYFINTIGLYAKLGTDAALLFAVVTAITPDQMPVFDADNPSAFIYNIQMTVQNANSVSIAINPAGTVTVEQIGLIVDEIESKIGTRAPINHAVANTTYGIGNGSNYGHVKLSDTYNNPVSGGGASDGLGASQNALYNAYDDLNAKKMSRQDPNYKGVLSNYNFSTDSTAYNAHQVINVHESGAQSNHMYVGNSVSCEELHFEDKYRASTLRELMNKPPKNHASTSTNYGVASSSKYGHVKTSTGINNSDGTISVAYGNAAGTACQGNDSRLSNARTPKSHASTGTGYGAGNTSNYGHVKLSDNYTSSAGNASQSVAASSAAVHDCFTAIRTDYQWYSATSGSVTTRIVRNTEVWKEGTIHAKYSRGIVIIIVNSDVKLNIPAKNTAYKVASGLPQSFTGLDNWATLSANWGGAAKAYVTSSGELWIMIEGNSAETGERKYSGQIVYFQN